MERSIELSPHIHFTGEGAAWLPAEKTLVIADLHVGYDIAARRRGGFLPRVRGGAEIGERILLVAKRFGAQLLVIAGDLRHSARDLDEMERREVALLGEMLTREIAVSVLRGNHDRGAPLIGGVAAESVVVGDIHIVHEPPASLLPHFTICGHLHPRLTVRDETGASSRFPCALVSDSILVLPAWSEWAGGVEASRLIRDLPAGRWRAIPIHDGRVGDLGIAYDSRVSPP